MDVNTTLIMFAVIAAFGLMTATLVLPIVPQVLARGPPLSAQEKACSASNGRAFHSGCI